MSLSRRLKRWRSQRSERSITCESSKSSISTAHKGTPAYILLHRGKDGVPAPAPAPSPLSSHTPTQSTDTAAAVAGSDTKPTTHLTATAPQDTKPTKPQAAVEPKAKDVDKADTVDKVSKGDKARTTLTTPPEDPVRYAKDAREKTQWPYYTNVLWHRRG